MKIKAFILGCLLAPSIFADPGDASGTINKVIFSGAGTTATASAVFIEVTCGSGCTTIFWIGHEEKDALNIVLSAKTMGVGVAVKASTGSGWMASYEGIPRNHANRITWE